VQGWQSGVLSKSKIHILHINKYIIPERTANPSQIYHPEKSVIFGDSNCIPKKVLYLRGFISFFSLLNAKMHE
jgi:hypothetical protein